MSHGEKYADLWTKIDPAADEHAKIFLAEILANRKEADRRWTRGNYLFIILTAVFLLLLLGKTQQISFLSIEIKDVQFIRLLLPTLLAFVYYQSLCGFFFSERLREVIDGYFKTHLKPAWEDDLELALDSPSFYNIERFFSRTNFPGAMISNVFGICLSLVILVAPLIVTAGFVYLNSSLSSHIGLRLTFGILPSVILLRCVFLIVSGFWMDVKTT